KDGQFLIYKAGPFGHPWLMPMPLQEGRKPIAFALGSSRQARFSPDGHWIAHSSTETGRSEVYVAPFPGRAGKTIKVSIDGGSAARWRRDGKELFYLSGERSLMSVDVREEGFDLQIGPPNRLFDVPGLKSFTFQWPYDVSPDGRFIMNV